MKAAILAETGLMLQDAPRPVPKANQILVEVRAAALNRADLLNVEAVREGRTPGHGHAIGREWAGTVVEVGEGVRNFAPGDRVMCSGSGGIAQYAVTAVSRVRRMPDSLTFEQAASLPVALQTMHDAIVTHGQLAAGQSVLIQGASSGVGLMGLQIAKLMGAGLVIGTSTNVERRERLREFGADLAIDSRDPAWAEQVREATEGRGVDLIIDQVSGTLANDNLRAAALCGRIVNVGRLGGNVAEFDFDLHALKRITYVGVTFRTRTPDEVAEIVQRAWSDLGEAVAQGKLKLPIDKVFALDDIETALGYMADNRHFGKIVIAP